MSIIPFGQAYDGQQALELTRRYNPAFIILDLMLPKIDGLEVCKELRRASDVPILILSARGEEIDRILGLSLGADDYLVKPLSPRELVARVKAILRRTKPDLSKPSGSFKYRDLYQREVIVQDIGGLETFKAAYIL